MYISAVFTRPLTDEEQRKMEKETGYSVDVEIEKADGEWQQWIGVVMMRWR